MWWVPQELWKGQSSGRNRVATEWEKLSKACLGSSRGCPRTNICRCAINESKRKRNCVNRGVSEPMSEINPRK